ncbi:hypothetical protein [Aliivibrio fischeri]|uniref:hypothetical protein n=1 Tax=Aliivibrio fischeri TaxID=668 RepID=UPI0012DAE812|nr:hypothetical protein [Aliivibrio fischeri]MUJ38310.1 hypothetical protein [Aliivibrio fischeri]
MIKKINKLYISYTLNTASILFLLPVFLGLGCNNIMNFETNKYFITGSCKLGIIDLYYSPKDKKEDESAYFHLHGLNMEFDDNRAIYIYAIHSENMFYNHMKVKHLNRLAHRRYFQFHIINSKETIMLTSPNGDINTIKLNTKPIDSF